VDVETWLRWLRTGDVPSDWRGRVDDPRKAELSLLHELRAASDDRRGLCAGLRIDRLELEGSLPDTAIRAEFRAERRYPRCRFRWRWPLWDDPCGFDDVVFWANLVEIVEAADIVLPGKAGAVVDVSTRG